MTRAYLELFAGGAACALALMAGDGCVPPVGYMGGKRRLASSILGAAGLRVGGRSDRVLLCDAGEWGEVWHQVTTDAPGLAARLLAWVGRDPSDLWRELASAPRPEDPQERAAAYLWLQGRAANNSPVWWEQGEIRMTHRNGVGGPCEQHQPRMVMSRGDGLDSRGPIEGWGRIVMPEKGNRGTPVKPAVERSTRKALTTRHASSGVTRPETVARRVLAAGRALAGARVDRQHPDPFEVSCWLRTPGDLTGVVVLLDPPYVGATRYEVTCPRPEVVALAEAYRSLGAFVLVCEAVPVTELVALGWHGLDLRNDRPGRPEWLTSSEAPSALARPQLALPLQRVA